MTNSKSIFLQPEKHIQEYSQICPHCKHENKLQLKTVIDISDSLYMKDMIINDDVNRFVCLNSF